MSSGIAARRLFVRFLSDGLRHPSEQLSRLTCFSESAGVVVRSTVARAREQKTAVTPGPMEYLSNGPLLPGKHTGWATHKNIRFPNESKMSCGISTR
jgi:hypothetical protein